MVEGIAFGAEHAGLRPVVADGIEQERLVGGGISKVYWHSDHLFQNIIFFSLTYYTIRCPDILQ